MGAYAEIPQSAESSYTQALDELALALPEIAQNREIIEENGKTLVDAFAIGPTFFESGPARPLFLAALAQRNAALEANRDTLSVAAYTGQKELIGDATLLLASSHSGHYDEMRPHINTEDTMSDEEGIAVLDRHTNRQVTQELQDAIDSGLLDDVKDRLGITTENEDPYTLHVLNIGESHHTFGMRPQSPEYGSEGWRDYQEKADLFESYTKGLKDRTERFKTEANMGSLALAWVMTAGEERHLNITLPTAEKILYTDQERSAYYDGDAHRGELAILGHEYAHTQGGLALDGAIYYGIMAEERRADVMSNNPNGYPDAKGFIDIDLLVMSGLNVSSMFASAEKGGDPGEFYTTFAKQLGLQGTLEFALTIPDHYVSDTRPMQKNIHQRLGGINGFLQRTYDRHPPERRQRVDAFIEAWAKQSAGKKGIDSWLALREKTHGLQFVTQRFRDALMRERESRQDK